MAIKLKKTKRKKLIKKRDKNQSYKDMESNFNNDDVDYSTDIFSAEETREELTQTGFTPNKAELNAYDDNDNKLNQSGETFEYDEYEEPVSLREALKFKITWKTFGIFIGILVAASVLGFTLSKIFPGGKVFHSVVNLGDVITNDKIECTVSDIVVTDTLSTVKASEGNTFVCIYYEYKNVTDKFLKWEEFPFTTLGAYDTDSPGYTPDYEVSNESIDKDALREYSYIMGVDLRDDLDPLSAGNIRDGVDVFEIKKSALESKKIYLTFDIYDKAIKVVDGLSELPNLDETIKENQKEIKKEQEKTGITQTE